MKSMNCRQLGGACDKIFRAETFEEIAEMSKKHGFEMYQKGDAGHIKAMEQMQKLMQSPEAMDSWFEEKKKEFESSPNE